MYLIKYNQFTSKNQSANVKNNVKFMIRLIEILNWKIIREFLGLNVRMTTI